MYAWGAGDDGQLGLGSCRSVSVPALVMMPEGEQVTHIACGAAHSLSVTCDGRLYAWGCGKHWQLGQPDQASVNKYVPTQSTAGAGSGTFRGIGSSMLLLPVASA